jgi:SEC-C motif-containing protein
MTAKTDSDNSAAACPCGSGLTESACCGPYLRGEALPETAEQLMRSRYTAFVRRDEGYLLSTWHADFRPRRVRFALGQRWLGLQIRATAAGAPGDDRGSVEFVARYKVLGRGHRLHEISRFERVEGRWYYCEGEHR